MQVVANIPNQKKWKQAFQDAVFELDPTRLRPKLEAAQKAVSGGLDRLEKQYRRLAAARSTLVTATSAPSAPGDSTSISASRSQPSASGS